MTKFGNMIVVFDFFAFSPYISQSVGLLFCAFVTGAIADS